MNFKPRYVVVYFSTFPVVFKNSNRSRTTVFYTCHLYAYVLALVDLYSCLNRLKDHIVMSGNIISTINIYVYT